MNLATIVAVAAALGVLTWSRRSGLGWLSPANLYAVVWAVAVWLYDVRLFPFYDLAAETWALIAAGSVSFVVAAAWASTRGGQAGTGSRTTAAKEVDPFPVIRAFLAIGLCGSAVFLWRIHNFTGLGTFFLTPQPTYNALTLRIIDTSHLFLYYFGIAGAIMFGYAVLLLRRRPRAIDVALLAVFVVAMMIAMERTHFLWVVASWVFLWLAPSRRHRTLAHVALALTVAALVALPYYLAVGKWLGKTPSTFSYYIRTVAESAGKSPSDLPAPGGGKLSARAAEALRNGRVKRVRVPPHGVPGPRPASTPVSPLISPGGLFHRFSVLYIAVGAALPTFNYIVFYKEPPSYGRMTLRPIVRLAERLRLIPGAEDLSIYPDAPTPYPANAYTYLYEFYSDFRWPGVILLPAVLGWLSGLAYARTREAAGFSAWPLVLSQLQGMILWTPFANRFITTVNVYTVLLLISGSAAVVYLSTRGGAQAPSARPSTGRMAG